MRVAVTGAAGHVGINLIEALARDGCDVVAIDRVAPRPGQRRSAQQVSWKTLDITDTDSLSTVFEGVQIVYHLAAVITLAHEDQRAWDVNVLGTRNIARAALASGVRRLVHCSSMDAFDKSRRYWPLTEAAPPAVDPSLPVYGRSKAAAESALRDAINDGLDAVICNPTGIFGPLDHPGCRLNRIILLAARGLLPVSINAAFDMVDVRDVAAGLIAAASHGNTGENYLLGGHAIELTTVMRLAARQRHRPGPLASLPLGIVRRAAPVLDSLGRLTNNDILSSGLIATLTAAPTVDASKARRVLGHQPRPAVETVADLLDASPATEKNTTP